MSIGFVRDKELFAKTFDIGLLRCYIPTTMEIGTKFEELQSTNIGWNLPWRKHQVVETKEVRQKCSPTSTWIRVLWNDVVKIFRSIFTSCILSQDPQFNIVLRRSFPDENPYIAIGLVRDAGPPDQISTIPTMETLRNLTREDFSSESLVYPLDLKDISRREDVRVVLVGETQKPSGSTDSNQKMWFWGVFSKKSNEN